MPLQAHQGHPHEAENTQQQEAAPTPPAPTDPATSGTEVPASVAPAHPKPIALIPEFGELILLLLVASPLLLITSKRWLQK